MLYPNLIEKEIVDFIKKDFKNNQVNLHEPIFTKKEITHITNCIKSSFVSSVGPQISEFENKVKSFTNSKYAIATINGTSALHIALKVSEVKKNTEVITQPLTFVATINSIIYNNATPIFLDVDRDTMGLSPKALKKFLEKNAYIKNNKCWNKTTEKRIVACLPMHTFGFPCRINKIKTICDSWNINLIEDSAESLGSFFENRHTGTFGKVSTFSFNGNKIITTGGGGMIITNEKLIESKIRHLITTAKIKKNNTLSHDMVGYNYRLPNLNASLGCAQMEKLKKFLKIKKIRAKKWNMFFKENNIDFVNGIKKTDPNYWLYTIIMKNKFERNNLLQFLNANNIMARSSWKLMHKLPMFNKYQCGDLKHSEWLSERIINLPSSPTKIYN